MTPVRCFTLLGAGGNLKRTRACVFTLQSPCRPTYPLLGGTAPPILKQQANQHLRIAEDAAHAKISASFLFLSSLK